MSKVMVRFTARCIVFIALIVVSVPGLAQNPTDRVYYKNKEGRIIDERGTAKESAKGIVLANPTDKKEKTINAQDIVRVIYADGSIPGFDSTQFNKALTFESINDNAKAAAEYALLAKSPVLPAKAKRFIGFRELICTLKVLDAKTGDDFSKEAPILADRLKKFSNENKASWEVWSTARLAARLYCEISYENGLTAIRDNKKADTDPDRKAEIENLKQAVTILEGLAANTGLSPDQQMDAKYLTMAYYIRAGDYGSARAMNSELQKEKGTPSLAERSEIYTLALNALPAKDGAALVDAATKIEAVIAKSKEVTTRSAGYMILGELYLAYKQPRDAMWAFLWIDAVYNADKEEQLRAVTRLVHIFADTKENDRVELYREKLTKVRQ